MLKGLARKFTPPPHFFRLPLASPFLIPLLLISLLALAAHLAPAQTDTASAQEPSRDGPGEDEEDDGASAQSGAVGAALSDAADAYLSGGPSDLSVSVEAYERSSGLTTVVIWVIWAENHGGRDVHDVEVLVDRKNPLTGKVYYKFVDYSDSNYDDIPGDIKDQHSRNYVELGDGSGVWRIGSLPAGSRKGMGIVPRYEWTGNSNDEPPLTTGPDSGRIVAPLSVEIHNPRHRDPNPENNRDTAWLHLRKNDNQYRARAAFNTLLEAKADNLRPANNDGQTLDFTLRMENLHTRGLDTRVSVDALLSHATLDVTLSGLKVKTAPTSAELNGTTFQCKDSDKDNDTLGACADGDDYAEWDVGFLYEYRATEDCASTSTTGRYDCRQLTLKLALDGDTPLEERCLEARIRSLPAPEGWLGGPVKVCLGADDPTRLLLEDGEADLFTIYPCVGNIAYPCDSADSLEVAAGVYLPTGFARRSDVLGDPTNAFGPRNVNYGKAVVQTDDKLPANIFIQASDPGGRIFDSRSYNSEEQSVNGGSVVSWQTGRNPGYACCDVHKKFVPGVRVSSSLKQFHGNSDWQYMSELVSVSGLGDANNPVPDSQYGTTCATANDATLPSNLLDLPAAPGDLRFRYVWSAVIGHDLKATNSNYPRDKTFNKSHSRPHNNDRNKRPYQYFVEFSNLGTYVVDYHASLQRTSTATYKPGQTFCDTVRYVFHAGPVADLALRENADQSGYSVSAMNNGPDPAEWAEVKLNVTNATNASVTRGCFDPSTGVWGLSQKWNATTSACEDLPKKRLPGDADPRFHPGDEATLTFSSGSGSVTAQIYNRERCVNAAGVVQSATTEIACIYSSATTTPPTRSGNHWGSYEVCVDYDSAHPTQAADAIRVVSNARLPIENENHCTDSTKGGASDNTWDVGTVYDYDELNNSVTMGRTPGAVGNLRASRDASDETLINISWSAPGGSPAPTGYDLEYQSRAANSGPWSDWKRTATELTGTSYAFSNAGGGTGYRFRVRSVTASNPDDLTSSWRTSSAVGTVSNPSQVRNLRAARLFSDETKIDVTWEAPSGGTTPTSYELEYRENGGAWTTAPNRTDTSATTYQLTDAKGNSYYQFQARAVTITGGDTIYGSWRSSNTVQRVAAPNPVGNLRAERQFDDETKIDVTWTAPSNANSRTSYEVSHQRDGGAWSSTSTVSTTTYTFGQALGNSRYVFRVRGVTTLITNERLEGSWRNSNTVSRVPAPGQVGSLRATRQFDDERDIVVSWTAPGNATGETRYDVEYQRDGGAWTSAQTGLNATTYEFGNQAYGQSRYVFRVRGVTTLSSTGERLEGSWRNSNTVQRVPTPNQVGNPRATRHATNDTIINVTWSAPSNATGATDYDVEYQEDGGAWTSARTNLNTTTYEFTSANGNYRYVFRVRAATVSDGSDLEGSWRSSNTVPVLPAPNRVGNVRATRDDANENRIVVSWNAPTSGTTPTGYEVQYKENNAGDWKPDTPTDVTGTTTAVFSDATIIKGGSRYQFQVRAYTTLNSGTKLRGGWRSSNNVAGLPAGNILSVTATRDGHDPTKINISWSESARATVGYQVQHRKNNGGWSNATTTGPSARSYTKTGVGGVETHTFRVRGISGAGNGAWTESSAVPAPPVGNHGYDVGVDWFTIKVTSGPWWYDYRDHKADWSSCKRVASGSKTLTGLRPETTYLVDVYNVAGCSSGHMGRHSIHTLSDWNNPDKCWNATDCRSIDNPTDFSNHTHKRSRLHILGENRSDCAHSRVHHSHNWPDGGGGSHWHCPY